MALLACVLALLVGCAPLRPPPAPLRSRLELATDRPPSAIDAGPPAVVFAAPTGVAPARAEIALVFNQPLRPLELAPDQPAISAELEPAVAGHWEWVGSSAWRFVPDEVLPAATHFTVTVPAGELAPGKTLAAPYRWTFDSERPRLVTSTPDPGGWEVVLVKAPIRLTFNLPVDPAEVLGHVSLKREGAEQEHPLEIDPSARHAPEEVVLRPVSPLQESTRHRLLLHASLPSTAGPLPMGEAREIAFKTAGPIRVLGARCAPAFGDASRCDPDGAITLELSEEGYLGHDLVAAATIEPRISLSGAYRSDEDGGAGHDRTMRYRIDGLFEPGARYRLRLKSIPATADREAIRLAAPLEQTFVFADRSPSVELGGRGTFWPAADRLAFELATVNAVDAELSAAQPTPSQILARLAGGAPAIAWGAPRALPSGKRNERATHRVRVDQLVSGDARGPLVIRASWRTSKDAPPQTIERELQRTDLGLLSTITARRVHLWVTRLSDGKPVSGATVELRRVASAGAVDPAVLARGRSDAQGIAQLAIPEDVPRPTWRQRGAEGESAHLVAFVKLGDDWAYQPLDTQADSHGAGIAYTERGLYRPGEQVHLAGIERERGDGELVTPAGRAMTVVVNDSAGREMRRFQVTLSDFGSWHQSLRLPETAALGTYSVHATLGQHDSHTWFEVAEYHPTDFTVAAGIDADRYIRGEELGCVASGRYLHGGPMAGAKLRVELSRQRSYPPPLRELEGFTTYDAFAPEPPSELRRTTVALDRAGEHRERLRLDLPGMNRTERVICAIYASDLDERELYESDGALVHPAEAYLGVHLPHDVAPGERFDAQAHAADLVDRPYPMAVTLELSRRITDPASGEGREEVLDRCELQTGPSPARCSFLAPDDTYSRDERFLVVRARGQDRHGRPLLAADEVVPEKRPEPLEYVPPAHESAGSSRFLRVRVPERELKPGEVEQIDLSSPYDEMATALVRVRNDDVRWQKVIRLPPAGAVVAVPIADAMIPEASVDVFAVQGSRSEQDSRDISVSHASKVLAVTVEPSRTEATPGEEIDLAVEVLDAAGHPAKAEVTLYGADVATLWLARYRTPKPDGMWLWGFGGGTDTHDARRDLFSPYLLRRHRSGPPRVRMGGTSVGGELRGDFRQTVFFATGLVTDAQGRVKRRVRLPDGLTTYRFMAVVTTADDRFGSGEAEVVSNKPLMVRPKLPAVVRSGDRFEVAALVTASGGPMSDVQVGLSARGLTIEGPSSAPIDLEADVAKRVAFRLRADRAGPFELVMRASTPDGKRRDAVVSRGQVVAPAFVETVAVYGDTEVPVAEAVGDLSTIRPDVGELTLTLARTRLAGLDRDIGGLIDYPYGCTEQTASRLLPLASLGGLSSEVGVELPEDAAQRIADAIERLRSHQQRDGGFGFWAGSRHSDPWLSAYATWVLLEARRAGTQVPAELVARASDYLRAYLAKALPEGDDALSRTDARSLSTAAFVVDVLATTPAAPKAAMSRLFASRGRLPAFARALLLHAMATASHPAAAERRTLATELGGSIVLDGDAAHMAPSAEREPWFGALLASDTRATALLLRALLAQAPDHPMAPKLVTGLLADLRARTATTQERAWALVALDAYRRTHPSSAKALEARVFLGQELVGEVELESAGPAQEILAVSAARAAAAGKGARLTFDVDGGELHYQARLRYARRELPTRPLQAGMQIVKRMSRMEPFTHEVVQTGGASMQIYAGDLVRVDLQVVTSASRHVVAIEDALAGGLVAVDPSMRTGLREESARNWDHRELRDDRVVFFVDSLPAGIHTFTYWARAQHPGAFVTPPAQAFEMYAPEVRGATAAATVTVLRRGASPTE